MQFKRFLKRLLLAIALCLTALLGYLLIASRDPNWFHPYQWDDQRRSELAKGAADKVLEIQTLGSDAAQQAWTEKHGKRVTTRAAKSLTQTFGEEELNAFFMHWIGGAKEKWEQYVEDPGIYLGDGRVKLAGRYKSLGKVLSLGFAPKIDTSSNLRLDLDRVKVGAVPTPRWVIGAQLQRAIDSLRSRLPAWQEKAKIEPSGLANGDAAAAGMAKLLLNSLHNQPSEPVLFLPVGNRYVVVKLTQIAVGDKTLELTVEPMDEKRMAELVERLKKPWNAPAK